MIQNTANRLVRNLFSLLAVFISFPLARRRVAHSVAARSEAEAQEPMTSLRISNTVRPVHHNFNIFFCNHAPRGCSIRRREDMHGDADVEDLEGTVLALPTPPPHEKGKPKTPRERSPTAPVSKRPGNVEDTAADAPRHVERPTPPIRQATLPSLASLDDLESQLNSLYGEDSDEDEISTLAASQRSLEDGARANKKVASRPRPVGAAAAQQPLPASPVAKAAETPAGELASPPPSLLLPSRGFKIPADSGGTVGGYGSGSPSSEVDEWPVLSGAASADLDSRSGAVSRGLSSESGEAEHAAAEPAPALAAAKQQSPFASPKSARSASKTATPTPMWRGSAVRGANSPSHSRAASSSLANSFDGSDASSTAKLETFRLKVEAEMLAEKQFAAGKLETDKAARREAAKARMAARGEKSPGPLSAARSAGNRTPAKT
jgi:hypothetical protein